jgi:hypothetical protein
MFSNDERLGVLLVVESEESDNGWFSCAAMSAAEPMSGGWSSRE